MKKPDLKILPLVCALSALGMPTPNRTEEVKTDAGMPEATETNIQDIREECKKFLCITVPNGNEQDNKKPEEKSPAKKDELPPLFKNLKQVILPSRRKPGRPFRQQDGIDTPKNKPNPDFKKLLKQDERSGAGKSGKQEPPEKIIGFNKHHRRNQERK